LSFQSFDFERHLMKVILSVTWWRLFWASPDEGYFELPDEGYFERHLMKVILSYLMKVILSVTWWRLFWASPDEGYFELPDEGYFELPDEDYFERHLMKVIPETRRAHWFWYLLFFIRDIYFGDGSTVLRIDVGNVLTVWYFCLSFKKKSQK
jgi:hypothetical protein